MRLRSVAVALLVALAGLLGAGCAALPLPCNITIAAVPPNSDLEAGDSLPADLPVLASPGDFDASATAILADVNGSAAIDLELQGPAIARIAAHTAGHIGESMAIAINGTVIAVAIIQSPLPDGKVQITSGAIGDNDLAERFAGCAR